MKEIVPVIFVSLLINVLLLIWLTVKDTALPRRLVFDAARDVKAGAAFVTADRADVVPRGQTVGRQQPGIGDARDLRTLDLAVGLWEGPQSILHTHQPVTVA